MVAGKAVIATRTEPLPEVLGEDCGLFFKMGNAAALAQAIETLYESPALRKNLGKKARLRACESYGLKRSAQCYEELYELLTSA
jgi:glycosyltransferase involved in cell wall biosynthesis